MSLRPAEAQSTYSEIIALCVSLTELPPGEQQIICPPRDRERQSLRRVDGGTLSEDEGERLEETFMKLASAWRKWRSLGRRKHEGEQFRPKEHPREDSGDRGEWKGPNDDKSQFSSRQVTRGPAEQGRELRRGRSDE